MGCQYRDGYCRNANPECALNWEMDGLGGLRSIIARPRSSSPAIVDAPLVIGANNRTLISDTEQLGGETGERRKVDNYPMV